MKDQKATALRRAKQLRRHACQACYGSRVKCTYAGNEANCCDRCERQGRECVPRMVVRGVGKLPSPCAGNGGAGGMSELDLNAYRSLALLGDLPHPVSYYVAAGALVKTYQALGFDKPPQSLLWALGLLSHMAMVEKSVTLVHASTTLALTMGVGTEFGNLYQSKPVPKAARRDMQQQVHREFAMSSASEAHFTICLGEVRSVLASPAYDFFFESEASMTKQLTRATQFRLWRAFVDDKEACDRFSIEMVKGCLSAPAPTGEPLRVSWAVPPAAAGEPLALRDKHGHCYSATLFAQAHIVLGGAFAVFTFGFKNIVPLDDGAVRSVRDFQALIPCPSGQNHNQEGDGPCALAAGPCALAAGSALERITTPPMLLSQQLASPGLGGDNDTDGCSSASSGTFSASSSGPGREPALDRHWQKMDSADTIACAWSDTLERMDETEVGNLMDSVLLSFGIDELNKDWTI